MNHLRAYAQKLNISIYISICITGLITLGNYVLLREYFGFEAHWALSASIPVLLLISYIISSVITKISTESLETVWQAIWHVSPGKGDTPAPQLDTLRTGRELLSSMVMQIYDLASNGTAIASLTGSNNKQPVMTAIPTFDGIPLPVIILDKNRNIVVANKAAADYVNRPQQDLIGKNCFDTIRLSFTSTDTLASWIDSSSQSRATDTRSWEHVRIQTGENREDFKQCDMTAAYSKDNSKGHETVFVLYDRSNFYNQQDTGMSYIALAVHELRTPLTILRGYIEVFEEELDPSLTPELREFMRKMGAAAQSLTAFVSNILNVARIDENQLVLSLHEADWNALLPDIVSNLQLRASVRGKRVELNIDPNLPKVAVDEISIYEVVSNLVDNAIKYSGPSPRIIVNSTLGKDGTIETVVQDFGIGLPANAMKDLFTKFYRSHRSRNAVSGSGLGLYLVKSIVTAHGGRVWANSKEGQGSSFGFSLQPYSAVAGETSASTRTIERQASGWIKNHSMYR